MSSRPEKLPDDYLPAPTREDEPEVRPSPKVVPLVPKAKKPREDLDLDADLDAEPKRRPLPKGLPDPGLTVVTDSGIPPLIGHVATALWLCLLRHANGRDDRRVKKIGYTQLRRGTSLSTQQIRDGLAVLRKFKIVQRLTKGETRNGKKRTAEYIVPFPKPERLQRWKIACEETR